MSQFEDCTEQLNCRCPGAVIALTPMKFCGNKSSQEEKKAPNLREAGAGKENEPYL